MFLPESCVKRVFFQLPIQYYFLYTFPWSLFTSYELHKVFFQTHVSYMYSFTTSVFAISSVFLNLKEFFSLSEEKALTNFCDCM